MIDWEGRLAREGPALAGLLRAAGAGKVLDVACGTGQHLAYLAGAGFRVAGADASEAMLARARGLLAGPGGAALYSWSMADPPDGPLLAASPFDAVLCLGNSLPHVIDEPAVAATLANLHTLLAPGGLLVLGLKALALLWGAKLPFLPLVNRRDAGADLLFVRFYDFKPAGLPGVADFHLVIIGPEHPRLAASGGVHHAVTRLRAWQPEELAGRVRAAGFEAVQVARDLAGTPWRPGDSEDIFVTARKASR